MTTSAFNHRTITLALLIASFVSHAVHGKPPANLRDLEASAGRFRGTITTLERLDSLEKQVESASKLLADSKASNAERALAAAVLGRVGTPAAVQCLAEHLELQQEDEAIKFPVVHQLINVVGENAIPSLIIVIESTRDEKKKKAAVQTLIRISGPKARALQNDRQNWSPVLSEAMSRYGYF